MFYTTHIDGTVVKNDTKSAFEIVDKAACVPHEKDIANTIPIAVL